MLDQPTWQTSKLRGNQLYPKEVRVRTFDIVNPDQVEDIESCLIDADDNSFHFLDEDDEEEVIN